MMSRVVLAFARRATALQRGPPRALGGGLAAAASSARRLSTNPTSDGCEPAKSADVDERFEQGVAQLEEHRLAEAVRLFADVAATGHAGGNFYLALAYDGLLGLDANGEHPVETSPEAAARCYLRAAEAGHPEAMLNLSMCYRNGEGVARDTAAAFEWVQRGAAAGSERSQFNAGVALDPQQPPWGTPGESGANAMIAKDPARAASFYRQAVQQGHAKAQVNLGILLYTGLGCAEDKAAAIALWREAAEAGVEQADICLRNSEAGAAEPAS